LFEKNFKNILKIYENKSFKQSKKDMSGSKESIRDKETDRERVRHTQTISRKCSPIHDSGINVNIKNKLSINEQIKKYSKSLKVSKKHSLNNSRTETPEGQKSIINFKNENIMKNLALNQVDNISKQSIKEQQKITTNKQQITNYNYFRKLTNPIANLNSFLIKNLINPNITNVNHVKMSKTNKVSKVSSGLQSHQQSVYHTPNCIVESNKNTASLSKDKIDKSNINKFKYTNLGINKKYKPELTSPKHSTVNFKLYEKLHNNINMSIKIKRPEGTISLNSNFKIDKTGKIRQGPSISLPVSKLHSKKISQKSSRKSSHLHSKQDKEDESKDRIERINNNENKSKFFICPELGKDK